MTSETDLLLERDAEIAVLTAGIRRTLADEGAFVVIAGPAGRGKTSLLNETARTATARGLRTLSGRGSPLEKEFAFGLVRQLFEGLLVRSGEQDRRRWLAGPAAAAGSLFGGTGEHPAHDEMALVHSLYWLTVQLSQDRPLLFAVDDLHWADEASLRFLAYLRSRTHKANVMVVATARGYASAKGVLGELTHDHDVKVLNPGTLSRDAVRLVLQTALGEAPSADIVSSCMDLTDGNPLLVKEIVRVLTDGGFAARQVTPDTVMLLGGEVLVVRLAVELRRLSPEARSVAEALAVLGDGAELGHLRLLSGLTEAELWTCLGDLESLELLLPPEPGGSTVRFLHPLIRSAVYRQLAIPVRFRYHQEAAELMIQQGGDAEESATHLLTLPSPPREHIEVLLRAADQAADRGDPEGAHRYLLHALKAGAPAATRLRILESAVTVASRIDMAQTLEHLKEMLKLVDDPVASARLLAAATWTELWLGNGHEMATRLSALADDLPDHETDARCRVEEALLIVGIESGLFPDYETRIPGLRELTRSTSLDSVMLQTSLAYYEALKGDPRGLARARLALSHPKMIDAASAGATEGHTGYFTLLLGDLNSGSEAFTELIKMSHARGGANVLAAPHLHRGLANLRQGELVRAEADLREVLALERRAPMGTVSHIAAGYLVEVLVERGRLAEAEELLDRLAPGGSPPPNKIGYSLRQARTRLLMAQGAYTDALESALSAGRYVQTRTGDNPALVAWRSDAALCLHAMGDHERALDLARQELDKAKTWGAPHVVGRSLRVLGRVEGPPAGERHLNLGVELLRDSGAQLELAKALIDLGSANRRRGQRAVARTHLEEGLDLVERLGAAGVAEAARSELRAAGGRPTGRKHSAHDIGRDALTPSEERVAHLAVEGLTNREIAQRLFVSVKTVEVHLSSVYKKLGLTRRFQLRDMLTEQETG
ncbi:LuxR family transcriptional regulator [Actinocorallia lasiicapitis]